MSNQFKRLLMIPLFMLACSLPVNAQYDNDPTRNFFSGDHIQAHGEHVLRTPPSFMNLQIVLSGRGKTAKEAAEALNDRIAAVTLQVEKMGAEKDSVETSEVTVGGLSERGQELLKLYQQELRGRREVPKGLTAPESVTLQVNFSAAWPLKSDDNIETLVFCRDLQQQITDADLAGLKEPQKLSLAEEELQAELKKMESEYYGRSETSTVGVPQFFYSAKLSDQQRAVALKAAFQNARNSAEALAGAAEVKVGKLVSLSGEVSTVSQVDDRFGYGGGFRQVVRPGSTGSVDELRSITFIAKIKAGYEVVETDVNVPVEAKYER